MSGQANGNGHARDSEDGLVVLRVVDAIEPKLAGHEGGSYESPAQTREQAMALARLLLGCDGNPDGEQRWTAPIPGGRRVVTLSDERDG